MKRIDTCQVCGAPRSGTQRPALCAEHRKEHDRARKAKERRDNPERAQLRNRIGDYLAEARRQGATDDQAWWCAMAAEARFQQHGHSSRWLGPFIAAELAALRAMPPSCQPEWQPPAETWELEGTA